MRKIRFYFPWTLVLFQIGFSVCWQDQGAKWRKLLFHNCSDSREIRGRSNLSSLCSIYLGLARGPKLFYWWLSLSWCSLEAILRQMCVLQCRLRRHRKDGVFWRRCQVNHFSLEELLWRKMDYEICQAA